MDLNPRLRNVEAFPVETENGPMIALRDPSGIASDMVVLSHAAVYILQYFNGENNIDTIMHFLKQNTRIQVQKSQIEQLIAQLDDKLFLENDHFFSARKAMEHDFLASNIRPARYAGTSYPENPQELRDTLKSFYTDAKGAGLPGAVNGRPTPLGLIAPHIDLRIGGATYSHAYKTLAEAPAADLYIIIGTGHAGLQNAYSVLPIDFETPLGLAKCDKKFVQKLAENTRYDFFSEVLPHKSEHTIEFQLVFLQQALSGKKFKIVPILASFGFQTFENPLFEEEQNKIADFTQALKKCISTYEGKVTVLASVDLAHVGPRYGDEAAPDDKFLHQVKSADMAALENIKTASADGWLSSISGIEDKYRICGFAPIYTLLTSINASKGEILRYDSGLMEDEQSVVSFCSAVLY